ncbi:MAG: hypothetical protein V9F04_07315 [Dermatophilaceae bacterium]
MPVGVIVVVVAVGGRELSVGLGKGPVADVPEVLHLEKTEPVEQLGLVRGDLDRVGELVQRPARLPRDDCVVTDLVVAEDVVELAGRHT